MAISFHGNHPKKEIQMRALRRVRRRSAPGLRCAPVASTRHASRSFRFLTQKEGRLRRQMLGAKGPVPLCNPRLFSPGPVGRILCSFVATANETPRRKVRKD
jgi:hypothetical protein